MDMDFIDCKTRKFISNSPIKFSTDLFAWGNKIHKDRDTDVLPSIETLNSINIYQIKQTHLEP
jgi:hypothetical protein